MDRTFDVLSEDTAIAVRRALIELAHRNRLSGAYLEFGVYQGYTLYSAYRTLDALNASDIRLFGFDSFRGLPAPSAIDDDGYHRQGMFCYGRQAVEDLLTSRGVDMRRITLVEGFFDRTLIPDTRSIFQMGPASVVLVDCDFYDSAKLVLDFVAPLLVEGSILLFDDWNLFECSPDRGERRAFREFLDATMMRAEKSFSFGWHGQSFIISGT